MSIYYTTQYLEYHYYKSGEDDIVIQTVIISAWAYTRPLLITQHWKLTSRKLKMIKTNRFQILNPDIWEVLPD